MIVRMDHDPLAATRLTRRGALAMLGAAGAVLAASPAGAARPPACVLTPAIEEGPFFVDTRLNRSNLTGGTTDPGVTGGVPLRLALRVYAVRSSTCAPLADAHVDLWHASATGLYSDEAALHTSREHYLRGYQVAGANGAVTFTTVFPGWYPDRTPHIHVKVRTYSAARNVTHALTSQLYFDEAVTDAVLAREPYSARGPRDTSNARDGLFDRTMVVALERSGAGYAGSFSLGLRTD